MDESQELEMSSLEAQLVCLYADRERLESELGTADSEPILKHIRSLEEKLRELEVEAREVAGDPGAEDFELRLAEVVSERESFFERMGASSFEELEGKLAEREAQAAAAADAAAQFALDSSAGDAGSAPSAGLAPEVAERFGVSSVEELVERYEELEQKLVSERNAPTPAPAVPNARNDAGRAAAEVRAFVDGLGGGLGPGQLRFEGELQSGRWSFSAGEQA